MGWNFNCIVKTFIYFTKIPALPHPSDRLLHPTNIDRHRSLMLMALKILAGKLSPSAVYNSYLFGFLLQASAPRANDLNQLNQ